MIVRNWLDDRVEQLSDSQLESSKKISCWVRRIKLFCRLMTNTILHIIAILVIISLNTTLVMREFVIICILISLGFYFFKYVKDMTNVRGFVDDKFRKEIPNNNTTKY